MSEYDYLQFGHGHCATCRSPVVSALVIAGDGNRWFLQLNDMELHISTRLPLRRAEQFTEHGCRMHKNTEIQHWAAVEAARAKKAAVAANASAAA